jgi:hypothetical protein
MIDARGGTPRKQVESRASNVNFNPGAHFIWKSDITHPIIVFQSTLIHNPLIQVPSKPHE